MLLYRISRRLYSRNIEGKGAKLFGGRWNNVGTPCIYTSESRALAMIEYAANEELDAIPRSLNMTIFEVPQAEFIPCKISELPGDWKDHPPPASTKDFGSKLLRKKDFLGVRLPSVIIPQEYNYLINPVSAKSHHFRIVNVQDFVFDIRIKN